MNLQPGKRTGLTPSDKASAYYAREGPYREAIGTLRTLALQTEAQETFKWSGPVYTVNGKNVFGIRAFKHHFSLWFFNGVILKDPHGVLETAQQETRAMRHWKFTSAGQIDASRVLPYMQEAIEALKKGLEHKSGPPKPIQIPPELQKVLNEDRTLRTAFMQLPPYKQREFCEYIASAKRQSTKQARLEKSIPLMLKNRSLNDRFRRG